jgi:hypothetical protein
MVGVECQEVGQVKGALLSAATIAGIAIVDIEVLAINGISINIIYRFLIILSSSSSLHCDDCDGGDEDSDGGGDSKDNNNDDNDNNGDLKNLSQEKLQHGHHCHRHSQQVGLKYLARHHWRRLGWWQEQLVQQWHQSWLHSLRNQCLRRLHHLGFGEAARLVGTSLQSPLKPCSRQNLRGYQELVSAKWEMERSQKSNRVVQIYPNILAGELT